MSSECLAEGPFCFLFFIFSFCKAVSVLIYQFKSRLCPRRDLPPTNTLIPSPKVLRSYTKRERGKEEGKEGRNRGKKP